MRALAARRSGGSAFWARTPDVGFADKAVGCGRRCLMYVRGVNDLSASIVLIAILLGILLVGVLDVLCLLHLGTAANARFAPKFVWAVLIVCASPIGGLVYLLAQRLPKRSPDLDLVSMATRHLLGQGWSGPPR